MRVFLRGSLERGFPNTRAFPCESAGKIVVLARHYLNAVLNLSRFFFPKLGFPAHTALRAFESKVIGVSVLFFFLTDYLSHMFGRQGECLFLGPPLGTLLSGTLLIGVDVVSFGA